MKDLLQKYKENALSEAENEAIEQKMLATITHNEQKQKWATLLSENGIERTPKVVRKLPLMRYIMGIAATVFIAAALWWTMGKSGDLSATQLTDNYMSEQFANPSTRDAKDELSEWSAAKQAYAKRDFAAAIKNIDAIGSPNDEQIFYKSLSFMYLTPPDLDKASEGFVQLLRKNQNFADESQWFYILIALKKGEKEAAISMLENVIGKQNSYSEKAATLLKKLK
jgi:tetratricopeptide (TPR) repeat protein